MNLQEFKNYLKQKKRLKVIEWEKQRQGNYCSGCTDAEYVQSMKEKFNGKASKEGIKVKIVDLNKTRKDDKNDK